MAIEGHLREMGLTTLVQMACQEGHQARLNIQRDHSQAVLYFSQGNVVHAILQQEESTDDIEGEEAIYRILSWKDGSFNMKTGIDPPNETIYIPWSALLLEGLRLQDEEQIDALETEQTRSDNMSARTTTDILQDFLEVPGVSNAVVVGRDGFVIEAGGDARSLDLDALGASLAHAINGIVMMGEELQISAFQDLFVEYQDAVIISRPVGDAIIALVTPDSSQLGIVRYQIKALIQELADFF